MDLEDSMLSDRSQTQKDKEGLQDPTYGRQLEESDSERQKAD